MDSIRIVGLLGVLLTIPSSCGSNTEKASMCSSAYNLGCVGDGRQESTTTPGELSTTSCAKDAYTYFKLNMVVGNPTLRSQVDTCSLDIADSSGRLIGRYVLPSGTTNEGQAYGCREGLTPLNIGVLSYSSCCAANDVLQFTLDAASSDGTVLVTGTASGPCTKHKDTTGVTEVPVNLAAN